MAHSRAKLASWPKGTKDGNEATNLINFARESSQVYANTISGANTLFELLCVEWQWITCRRK